MKEDVVVIGGSAAGITAAITARRNYPDKSVTVVRREKRTPIPCGIPYIFGTLSHPDQNLIPDTVLEKSGIGLSIAECTAIDTERKEVRTSGGTIGYDRLVIATGGDPIAPPIPGAGLDGVFPISKDMDFLCRLRGLVADARHVIVVGGGFIGVEFADEIMKNEGKTVTIVEMAPHCLSLAYDEEFCIEAEERIRQRGIAIRTSARVEALTGDGHVRSAKLSSGEELEAELVILGLGVRPNAALARGAGIEIGQTGAIKVDRRMETSVPGVFACGDCAEKISYFGGHTSALRLASIATQEARIAGANVFETRRQSVGTVGVWSTMVAGLALGTSGLTEAAATGLDYHVVTAVAEGVNRHPSHMPGGTATKLKLVFDASTHVILGGQASGGEAVGETINMVAALVQAKMRADDIALFQMGTHPALTASPIAYQLVNAAEAACGILRRGE